MVQKYLHQEGKTMRKQTIKFSEFMDGSYKVKKKDKSVVQAVKCLTGAVPPLFILVPKIAFAGTVNSAFGNIHGAVMNGIDAGVVLVFVFAGVSWMLGHRGKAIETLIGASCGFILCRHAIDIRDFLKTI